MESTFWRDRRVFLTAYMNRWLAIIILGIILLFGTMLRLDDLDIRTMGHIEVYVPNIELPEELSDPPPRLTLWKTLTGSMWEPHPPAWYLSMWPYTRLLGSDLFTIRLPSVLFGTASILLVYMLGTLVGDRLTAFLAAALLAFNGHHIFWSQIARPYSMACSLGLLSTVLLLLVLRGGQRQRLFLSLYLVVSLYGLAVNYYLWLVFGTHIIWILLDSWMKKGLMLGLIRSQLLALILASPLIALAVFQSRRSYLDSDSLRFFKEFLQFGFLFEPDIDVQNPLPTIARFALPFCAFLLLIMGIASKSTRLRKITIADIAGPSLKHLALTAVFAFLCIIFAARTFHGYQPGKTHKILATGAIPLLILLFGFLLQRYLAYIHRLGVLLNEKRVLSEGPYSLISFLVIMPVIILAGISLSIPFLASRHMLLFTPYLLIVLSGGVVSISHKARRFFPVLFVIFALLLAVTHYSSIVYSKHRPGSPTDYKGLVEQWIPNIKGSDLIFVQRHWATTPIFYYLKEDLYHFVGRDYSQEINRSPNSRVWVLHLEGIPITEEMEDALSDYALVSSIDALRIRTDLFARAPNVKSDLYEARHIESRSYGWAGLTEVEFSGKLLFVIRSARILPSLMAYAMSGSFF